MKTATTSRERFGVKMRTVRAYSYYALQKTVRSLARHGENALTHFVYYPTVTDAATLGDLVNRISWYLPCSEMSQPSVSIAVDRGLRNTALKELVPPSSQHNYNDRCDNVRFISPQDAGDSMDRADAIMLWNRKHVLDPRILRHLTKVTVVDPEYYSVVESITYEKMLHRTLDTKQRDRFLELSRKNYAVLLDKVAEYDRGYVFGTGPSSERAFELEFDDGFRIISNSMVKNRALLKHIKPHLLTLIDGAFFFSPCRYAAEFRELMLETEQEFEYYIMVRDYQLPLLLSHCPHLEDRVIGMPVPGVMEMTASELIRTALAKRGKSLAPTRIPGRKEQYNFPTPDRFYVRNLANVMTNFMIPVASSVCTEIYFLGADGRPSAEKAYYAAYSASTQFTDLMQTVCETHPSVFRDGVVTDTYEEHCRSLEGLLRYGESLGKRYFTLAPSHIPALAERLVDSYKR